MYKMRYIQSLQDYFFSIDPQKRSWLLLLLMNLSVFISMVCYAVKFARTDTVGWEFVVIRLFTFYSLFRPELIKRFIFQSKRTSFWFILIYSPYVLYSLWFAFWGVTHQWLIAAVYPVLLSFCFLSAWNTLQAWKK